MGGQFPTVWAGPYQDEVTADIGSDGHKEFVCTPQEPNIVQLHNQHGDPIDVGNHWAQAEWRFAVAILAPDCMAVVVVVAISWSVKCVVGANHYQQQPR